MSWFSITAVSNAVCLGRHNWWLQRMAVRPGPVFIKSHHRCLHNPLVMCIYTFGVAAPFCGQVFFMTEVFAVAVALSWLLL